MIRVCGFGGYDSPPAPDRGGLSERSKGEVCHSHVNKLKIVAMVLGGAIAYVVGVKTIGQFGGFMACMAPFVISTARSLFLRDQAKNRDPAKVEAYNAKAWGTYVTMLAVAIPLGAALLAVDAHNMLALKNAQISGMQDVFDRVERGEREGIAIKRKVTVWPDKNLLPQTQTLVIRPKVDCNSVAGVCSITPSGDGLSKALLSTRYHLIGQHVSSDGMFVVPRGRKATLGD